MIEKEELRLLLPVQEKDRVEKTVSVKDANKFGEAICAFANDLPGNGKPGYLIIGANDDGTLAGLQIEEKLIQLLLDFRQDGRILPPPLLAVQKFEFDDGEVAVVEVQPSRQPPVRYKGKVCIRVGPRASTANDTEEKILSERRSSFARTFDLQPCRESSLQDLSTEIFKLTYLPGAVDKETLEANHREIREQLASLRFFDLKEDCPTNAGVLMFGRNPLYFLPGAYIQFVRFAGADVTSEFEFEKKFEGDLVTQMSVINEFIKAQIVKTVQPALGEGYHSNYPETALRELVFNAIIHRDYQSNAPVRIYEYPDRLEITNPGGLFGDVRPENFPFANDYRNPSIADAAKVLGWVNKFSVGVRRALDALKSNGNPAPEFILNQITTFGVTVYKRT